jgi:hypothetical protein
MRTHDVGASPAVIVDRGQVSRRAAAAPCDGHLQRRGTPGIRKTLPAAAP